MTDTPQLAGADLARLALENARRNARTSPAPAGPARPRRATRRGTGRDPVPLGAALTALGADLPLQAGTDGGNILDQWPTLCPQYAGLVQPVAYDTDRGRLDLRPASPAYATQLRLLGAQLAKQINDKIGRPVVRTIRVLPPGPITTGQDTVPADTTAPAGPVKTRETAHPGYRAALEATLAHRPDRQPTDPYLVEAIQRQEAALLANRLPEDEHTEAAWEYDRLITERDGAAEQVRRAAIARARHERAGHAEPARLFGAA